ncbi:transthyretin domain-containing protein [Nannizzia gypsea CBS 118893]|uniref:Transthyretin domain-containing protein n=1 Tax=Arthroderma gypseum (strain ATCC MYA-4604 / CBS 118893) TaxID=535722 RepID=E5R0A1_ARTGP|nr:transthyretin domain-containing protein [Nannizzia gypsea CBS 118893]EFQ98297.1 transthyretin domain-containing protein [Nannizzia gypsea CBS 118893]
MIDGRLNPPEIGTFPSTSAPRRLSQLRQYLQPDNSEPQTNQSEPAERERDTSREREMAEKDPITCHVLNTYTGRPGQGILCVLRLVNYEGTIKEEPTFTATTDSDGRVKNWSNEGGPSSVSSTLAQLPNQAGSGTSRSIWSLRLCGIDEWYREQGVPDCFWPEVEVRFSVDGREGEEGWRHYHVPVLLGPWNYSTYRGS